MDVSVLIATHARAGLLDTTLTGLAASRFPRSRFEVLVADNADDPETRRVCERHAKALDLRWLVEPAGGKNRALNAILPEARGELLLFTDDDVEAEEDWIERMWEAAGRWPEHACFGGRVLPRWPREPPAWLRGSRYLGVCYTLLDLEQPEGPDPDFIPFGPNMGVRRTVFDEGMRYDDAVGPTASTSYIMGSEAELVRRLKARGHEPVYVPGGVVHHLVRPGQLRLAWLLPRSVRYGRSVAHKALQEGRACPGRPPRHLFREAVEAAAGAVWHLLTGRRGRAFDRAMDVGSAWGRIRQVWAE